MKVYHNISSGKYNTFGIDVPIETFVEIETKSDFNLLGDYLVDGFKVLGGGSNILISSTISEVVLHINNKGKSIIKEADDYVLVSVAAGENWHEAVMWSLKKDLGGIENLALIPGNAGTAPIQNIGAYGVELKDVFFALRAFNTENGMEYTFHRQECNFGYRNSIFKSTLKNKYIITEIILQLTKAGYHKINTDYGQIGEMLEQKGISNPDIADVAEAVIDIRQNKLPDPLKVGNAGSFFKNPVVDGEVFEKLKKLNSDIPFYEGEDHMIKIPAAWLIEQCGWKGKRFGDAGSYPNQPLVLVNYGSATGKEIYDLSEAIRESVQSRFGLELEREVNLW